MRRLLRILSALLLAAAGILLVQRPASALSCIGPEFVAKDSTHIFTGTIAGAHAGRLQVVVDEIWKGGPLERNVTLNTELDGWWDGLRDGTIPDGYRSSSPWLFMPHLVHGTQTVNPCTAWPTTTPGGKNLRPASVMPPLSESVASPEPVAHVSAKPAAHDDDGPNLLVRGAAAVLVIGAGALGWVLVRRRRS